MQVIGPTFPAKILLFGEYTVLQGSSALLFPYEEFQGHLEIKKKRNAEEELSHKEILHLFDWIQEQRIPFIFNQEKLQEDLKKGLFFSSTIPQGVGLGSSGALIAALYYQYAEKKEKLEDLKKDLSFLESFFHGESSGMDPLVIFTKKGILNREGTLTVLDKDYSLMLKSFTLYYTGKKHNRNVGDLVAQYKEKTKDINFFRIIKSELMPEVEKAIDAFLEFRIEDLTQRFN
ncbi:MAG: hypothetical protein KBD63_06165, partial [Bacteriovoracaceae bacterium]|nr:hypothetical protein [Bacteriovoracaceae bacterium]